MKQQNFMKLKNLIILAGAILLFGACTDTYSPVEIPTAPETPKSAVIVNTPDEAISGELMIKFRPEVTELLNRALTRSTNAYGTATRSGIPDMDRALEIIGSYNIERIFPVNRQEELTRKAGLNLWYIVRFDEKTDVRKAAEELAQVGEIAKIQYNRELKRRDDQRPAVIVPPTDAATRMMQKVSIFNDPGLSKQWHYINDGDQTLVPNSKQGADVNCAEAWKKCTGDPSIIVAVMDEGVMWAHPDLQANMWINEDEIYKSDKDNDGNGYKGDVYGYNFAQQTPTIDWSSEGDTGHGTHVAGTIAAVNNNGEGVCGIAGGSGNGDGVKIMSIQIFSGNYGTCLLYTSDAADEL